MDTTDTMDIMVMAMAKKLPPQNITMATVDTTAAMVTDLLVTGTSEDMVTVMEATDMDTIILKLSITITTIRELCISLIMDIKVIMGVMLVVTTEAMAMDITEVTTEATMEVTTEVTVTDMDIKRYTFILMETVPIKAKPIALQIASLASQACQQVLLLVNPWSTATEPTHLSLRSQPLGDY